MLDLLRGFGMTTVFGNPGSTELPLFLDFPGGLPLAGTELSDLDFVALAAGHGMNGVRVSEASALHAVLSDALQSSGPVLVEIVVA